ncbi:permease-like cell division protein FtsX [Peptococcus simiae]|uniref:permease-like cell division protein FtsX n=1 Tax=Peptococcus simiae TaxID=1643805 RepID=UPI00397EDBB0
MKWINHMLYGLRDTFRALFRHKAMAGLTVLTIAITLFILGAVILFALNSQAASQKVESELEMVAYLNAGLSNDKIAQLGDSIGKLPDVAEVKFVSKEDAINELNARFQENDDLKISLDGDNPLPDAYRIRLENADASDQVAETIKGMEGVEDLRYGQDLVQNVVKLNHSVKVFVFIAVALMLFATLFLISSTISLTVSGRREEINIMSLIGASSSTIRMPFFLEGIIIGAVGSIISIIGLTFGYGKMEDYISHLLPFLPIYLNMTVIYALMGLLLAIGVILGAIGSAFAVRRHLNV